MTRAPREVTHSSCDLCLLRSRFPPREQLEGGKDAPVALPVVALIASLVRWKLQGSGNLYTATAKQFWVEHPDFGWTVSDQHPIWLGLEVIAVIAAIAVGLVIWAFVIRWRERKTGRRAKVMRILAWVGAAVPLAVPIAAFATGFGPENWRDVRPVDTVAVTPIEAGIAGSIALPAGRSSPRRSRVAASRSPRSSPMPRAS